MRFGFEVGLRERHRVEFHFGRVLGPVRITVDGETVIRKFLWLSLNLTNRSEFKVGQEEVHEVVIDLTRALFLGAFRRQTCQVFVDGQAFGDYPGSLGSR